MKCVTNQLLSKYFLTLILILNLFSCGGKRIKSSGDSGDNLIGTTLSLQTELSDNEKRVAKRICDALRVRRSSIFELNLVGSKKDLTVSNKYCSKPVDNFTLSSVISSDNSGSLFYKNNTDKFFFKKIQTHIDGELKNLCPQILRDETVSLILSNDINNVTQVKFGFKNGDTFSIIKAKLITNKTKSEYEITQTTQYRVETVSSSDFGEVTSISKFEKCPNANEESYFLQI